MTLADTPTTWLEGPDISTLHVLAIFAGIPLTVMLVISLLVYAPSWVKGPRYRPGQPWDARSEWFGGSVAAEPAAGLLEAGTPAGSDAAEPAPQTAASPDAAPRVDQGSGGASAGW